MTATDIFCVISPGDPSDGAGQAAWRARLQNAYNRGCRLVTTKIPWSQAQASAGAPIDAIIANTQLYLDAAQAVGIGVVLEVALHYTPTFVQSGVEQFKNQNAAVWTGTPANGDAVRNWQWTAQGRTYVADLFAKIGQSGITAHPAIAGTRLGGGYSGEAHYAPITTTGGLPNEWWIYGASLQTGVGLASDQVACPHPGRTPLFNGSSDAADTDIANWWLNGMNVWMKWLIGQAEGAGFGRGDQKLWVMHPSTGVRNRPHTDAGWIQEVARGVAPRRLMGAYRWDTKVWPWATWNDPGSGFTQTARGSAAYVLNVAKEFDMLEWAADETTHTNTDLNAAYGVHTANSVDNVTAPGRIFNVISDASLNGGAAGDNTWDQYQSLITTGTASPPPSTLPDPGPHALWSPSTSPTRQPINLDTAVYDTVHKMTTAMLDTNTHVPYVALSDSGVKVYWPQASEVGRLTVVIPSDGFNPGTWGPYPCPVNAQKSVSGTDGPIQLAIYDGRWIDVYGITGSIVWNGNNGTATGAGGGGSGILVKNWQTGTGWPSGTVQNVSKFGFAACGASVAAGAITPEDKQLGYIAHTLALVFSNAGLANTPHLPALRTDSPQGSAYPAGNTYYHQGDRLAIIPPEKGGPAWNPNWSAWDLAIVKGFCYYGGHVMDRTSGGFVIRTSTVQEPGVSVALATSDFASTMSMAVGSVGKFLFDNLMIVTNYAPQIGL